MRKDLLEICKVSPTMKLSGTGGTKNFRGHYLIWVTIKELRLLEDVLERFK